MLFLSVNNVVVQLNINDNFDQYLLRICCSLRCGCRKLVIDLSLGGRVEVLT